MNPNAWYRKRRAILIRERGDACQACGEKVGLEFAHVNPTKCHGKGRGSNRRVLDVLKFPLKYVLLCMDCHDSLDGRERRKRQPDIRRHL